MESARPLIQVRTVKTTKSQYSQTILVKIAIATKARKGNKAEETVLNPAIAKPLQCLWSFFEDLCDFIIKLGGAEETRTLDPLLAKQVL